uniref:ZP domain-containing protein n=1 Tax=Onchocerca volvulus TaxID=6282 RepID=A0A8R1XNA7_ONCVO
MHINFNLLVIATVLSNSCFSAAYPNAILEKPIVTCEPERIFIQVRTSKSSPSHIYAENHIGDPDCASRNANWLSLSLGNCGMTLKKTKTPASATYRICIIVQLHPLFITHSDRSYCAQCVYMDSNVIEDLQQSLLISDSAPSNLEPQSNLVTPKCSYRIRRNSIDGPFIHYALLGETVYHVWKCYGENFQILVQNCYVEDGEGNQILMINSDGCGVDQYVLQTPIYSVDRRTASQKMNVFKFAGKALTRFTCQIRICSSSNDSCHLSAPHVHCPRSEEHNREITRSSGASLQKTSRTNQKLASPVTEATSVRPSIIASTKTVTTISERSIGKIDLITPITHSKSITTDNETSETEEPFFVPATDDNGFDMWSNGASPPSIMPPSKDSEGAIEVEPSIKPPPKDSEGAIEVEPSIYQRRTKRNYSTNRLVERDALLESSKFTKDRYFSYDVSGVLTVLESPDDVAYFESKYLSVGMQYYPAVRSITDAGSRSLVKCVPQFIFMALLEVVALSIILIFIIIPCIIHFRSRYNIDVERY